MSDHVKAIEDIERRWLRRIVVVAATILFTIISILTIPPLLLYDLIKYGCDTAKEGLSEWFSIYTLAGEIWRK